MAKSTFASSQRSLSSRPTAAISSSPSRWRKEIAIKWPPLISKANCGIWSRRSCSPSSRPKWANGTTRSKFEEDAGRAHRSRRQPRLRVRRTSSPASSETARRQTVDVTFEIDEGPRVYVERIDIVGNVRTLDEVIRREFRLVEGDAFSSALIRRSRQRIMNLGFFDKVDISTSEGSAPDRFGPHGGGQRSPHGRTRLRRRRLVGGRLSRRYFHPGAQSARPRTGPQARAHGVG